MDNKTPSESEKTQKKTLIMPAVGFKKENAFAASLKEYSSKDVTAKRRKKKKRSLGFDGLVRMLIFCMCIGVFAYSVYNIIISELDSKTASELYNNLQQQFYSGTEKSAVKKQAAIAGVNTTTDLLTYLGLDDTSISNNVADIDDIEYYSTLRGNLIQLNEKNPDTFGWIRINGTNIDYPIMKTDDNSYYLTHGSDKSRFKPGAIFADYGLDNNYYSNNNVVLYGHCMGDGTMFGGIKDFYGSSNRQAIADNMQIEIITRDGVYVYEIFSVYRERGSHFITKYFYSQQEYYSFLKDIKSKSVVKRDMEYSASSKVITLSTCTNVPARPDERYVVHGILKSYIKFE